MNIQNSSPAQSPSSPTQTPAEVRKKTTRRRDRSSISRKTLTFRNGSARSGIELCDVAPNRVAGQGRAEGPTFSLGVRNALDALLGGAS
jgi:hypothetical protein